MTDRSVDSMLTAVFTNIPGILLGYIDFAKNPAHRGSSSPVADLIVYVSSLVLESEVLLTI